MECQAFATPPEKEYYHLGHGSLQASTKRILQHVNSRLRNMHMRMYRTTTSTISSSTRGTTMLTSNEIPLYVWFYCNSHTEPVLYQQTHFYHQLSLGRLTISRSGNGNQGGAMDHRTLSTLLLLNACLGLS